MPDQTNITAIHDESADKKYFTIVPNYVIDHAGSYIDLALYLNMKRFAGEKGSCYASEKTLMTIIGVGRKALHSSIKELMKKELIKFEGFQQIRTAGGDQMIKAYSITDIWKKNVNHYDKTQGVTESIPLAKRTPLRYETHLLEEKIEQRGALSDIKGVRSQPTKKNNTNKNHREGGAKAPTPAEFAKEFFDKGACYQQCIEAMSKKTSLHVVETELDKFIEYWTEPNKSGTRVRWEQEPTFEIGRRLKTWFSRVRNYQQKATKVAFS